jgi:prepilin-type N-terminal cleavage/methylation domain-containing protein
MPHATSHSPHVTSRRLAAFTLIELLIVIAIIAILAGLAFPAMQGALNSGRKAQARNDVTQLAAAVKSYQLEYGKLPGASGGTDLTPADNKAVMSALTSSNTDNPRGIVFFEPKPAKGNKAGLGPDGKYYDPWGTEYIISLDTDYNNKISNLITTVIVESSGPDTNASTVTDNISNMR